MQSIAKLLGVSVSAVSIALNGKPGVSDEMREKIVAAAIEGGYNMDKLSSAEDQKRKICIIDRDYAKIGDAYFLSDSGTAFFRGIESAIVDAGYEPAYKRLSSFELTPETLAFEEDGAIVISANMTRDEAELYSASKKPIVVLASFLPGMEINTVTYDNHGASFEAVRKLADLGHREIGFLQLTQGMNNYYERQRGWRDALHSLDLTEGPVFTYGIAVNNEQEDLSTKIYEWLIATKPTATAYLTANDYIALAALRALRMYGKTPGEDVAIIGFDDRPFAQLCEPSLTTIRIEEENLGSAAAERLISLLRKPEQRAARMHITLPLILRESICAAKSANR